MLRVLVLRIFLSYLVITLIALQSMFAGAFSPALHQEEQVNKSVVEHFENHETKHHNESELALLSSLIDDDFVDGKHEHPSCDESSTHQNHCHHTSLVYLDLQTTVLLPVQVKNKIQPYRITLVSRVSSPNFRPPII